MLSYPIKWRSISYHEVITYQKQKQKVNSFYLHVLNQLGKKVWKFTYCTNGKRRKINKEIQLWMWQTKKKEMGKRVRNWQIQFYSVDLYCKKIAFSHCIVRHHWSPILSQTRIVKLSNTRSCFLWFSCTSKATVHDRASRIQE